MIIVPVPYDAASSHLGGSRKGPSAIIEASFELEWYDDELKREICQVGIHTIEALEPDVESPRRMVERVEGVVRGILGEGKIPVVIGGDHSISIGAVRAVADAYRDVDVVFFDAHSDMRDIYQGSKFSHACVGRRISEICGITQLGTRSMDSSEARYIKNRNIKQFKAPLSHPENFLDKLLEGSGHDIYISIDLDVLDPSIMPAVGNPEPGGVEWYDMLMVLRTICREKRVIGFDVVELRPIPGFFAPNFTAAKLVYKTIGYITSFD